MGKKEKRLHSINWGQEKFCLAYNAVRRLSLIHQITINHPELACRHFNSQNLTLLSSSHGANSPRSTLQLFFLCLHLLHLQQKIQPWHHSEGAEGASVIETVLYCK